MIQLENLKVGMLQSPTPRRRIIQMEFIQGCIVVLCNDGTMWRREYWWDDESGRPADSEWIQEKSIPELDNG